jgi:hypothetical protein
MTGRVVGMLAALLIGMLVSPLVQSTWGRLTKRPTQA